MKYKIEKYLKVLRIELEDLQMDLQMMAELCHQREERDEITDYVFLENISVLKAEIAGIERIIQSMDEIPIERFTELREFVTYADEMFRERTESSGYPQGVHTLVRRKLYKVLGYLESTGE